MVSTVLKLLNKTRRIFTKVPGALLLLSYLCFFAVYASDPGAAVARCVHFLERGQETDERERAAHTGGPRTSGLDPTAAAPNPPFTVKPRRNTVGDHSAKSRSKLEGKWN